MGRIAAVVFDFDGIVLDSETPEYESHRRIYERCGVPLTVADWCEAIGVWNEGHVDRRFETLRSRSRDAPPLDEYVAERQRIFQMLLPLRPMRGIHELLLALEAAGIPAAIASTSRAGWVIPAAERIGVRDLFDAVVTGDEVPRRKPAPDVYLEAARRLDVDPSDSVAIEDSAPGVTAARAAGMTVVAIPHWLTATHDVSAAHLQVAHAGELSVERLAALVSDGR
ncbi:MAG TPA: HAD-IA family hydrolase [Vicinamibacterales bacterium]|nr:HAD-IA family hydrolase [Vicinamibacterales bacterium]